MGNGKARRNSCDSSLHLHGWVGVAWLNKSTATFHMYIKYIGEGCSHIAAVLFKIECAVRLGYTAGTSQPCQWNEAYSQKARL